MRHAPTRFARRESTQPFQGHTLWLLNDTGVPQQPRCFSCLLQRAQGLMRLLPEKALTEVSRPSRSVQQTTQTLGAGWRTCGRSELCTQLARAASQWCGDQMPAAHAVVPDMSGQAAGQACHPAMSEAAAHTRLSLLTQGLPDLRRSLPSLPLSAILWVQTRTLLTDWFRFQLKSSSEGSFLASSPQTL